MHVVTLDPESPATDRATDRFALSVARGRFVDPETEAAFELSQRPHNETRARRASILAATLFLGFFVSDIPVLGATMSLLMAGCVRIAVSSVCCWAWWSIRSEGLKRGVFQRILVVEAAVVGGMLAIMMIRTTESHAHLLSFSAMILALFLLVPNRFISSLALNTAAFLAFVVVGAYAFDLNLVDWLVECSTVVGFYGVGALASAERHKSEREEYASRMRLHESNELMLTEIGRRELLEAELLWLAHHDSLTDILTRRAFFAEANALIASTAGLGIPICVVVLDADEFKSVNDRFGHEVGDQALRSITNETQRHLRRTDVFGRLGGEEFAIVLPGVDVEGARAVAERVCSSIRSSPLKGADHREVALSVSIGVASVLSGENAIDEALQRADEALYEAKGAGRDRVVVHLGSAA